MSKATMMLALEALEGLEALLLSMGLTHLIVYGDAEKAITNLQKELEDQPAQTATYTCGVCGVSMQMEPPAQQEPSDAQIALLDPWMRPAAAKELLTKVLALSQPAQPKEPAPVQGWKLVPVKPTKAMVDALADTDPEHESVWSALLAAAPQPAQQCRTDGRCQYAIDSGAEGMGHCPKGKCVMPAQQEKPVRFKCTVVDDAHPNGVPLSKWGQQKPLGLFLTREQAIQFCRKRRPDIEPTEQHIAATIDAYAALFGDMVEALMPAQRTWVGLTLEDMETTHWSLDFRAGAKWAANKLKEKNT